MVPAINSKDTEKLAAELAALGVSCCHYHADMAPEERESAHTAWSMGAVQVRTCGGCLRAGPTYAVCARWESSAARSVGEVLKIGAGSSCRQ